MNSLIKTGDYSLTLCYLLLRTKLAILAVRFLAITQRVFREMWTDIKRTKKGNRRSETGIRTEGNALMISDDPGIEGTLGIVTPTNSTITRINLPIKLEISLEHSYPNYRL